MDPRPDRLPRWESTAPPRGTPWPRRPAARAGWRRAAVCAGLLLVGLLNAGWWWSKPPPSDEPPVKLTDVVLSGTIEGENITFDLTFTAACREPKQEIPLVTGDVAVDTLTVPPGQGELRYDTTARAYRLYWETPTICPVSVQMAARPSVVENGAWREAVFELPASGIRQLELAADRTDLEVQFPGALRVGRETRDGKLTLTATLGPGHPFTVRWKPQVAELEAELVFGCEANTIATVSPGAMALDTLFAVEIAQGKLREMSFAVPAGLSVTQVRGERIRDWRLTDAADGKGKTLTVTLSRPESKQYGLQVLSETVLGSFPAEVELPVIEPRGGIRAGGSLAVGTNSAIQLRVRQTSGLAQIDVPAFPRLALGAEQPRELPQAKAFAYSYSTMPYQVSMSLDNIVPVYDAEERLAVDVREEDLVVDLEVELDIRDAPIRQVVLELPASLAVASVTGGEVEDHTLRDSTAPPATQNLEVHFRQPVLGRTLVKARLEMGRTPLDGQPALAGVAVTGAKSERGYVVISVDKSIVLPPPTETNLRQVHTGSVPGGGERTQYAYRFREKGWSLTLAPARRPAAVRAEAFHLVSLGEGILYGGVTINYFISGAPVDEFGFVLPPDLDNVEFVGRDIRRWTHEGNRWLVKLQRKVQGDYNLGVSYNQRYESGGTLAVGTVECADVQTQTGFITVASHLNLSLEPTAAPGENVLEVEREEVPPNYRLLVNAPVLKTYKFVKAPHTVTLRANAYERGSVLPIVVEVMDLATDIALRENRLTESVTRVRWKVKNASGQFLPVQVPAGAKVWATRLVEPGPAGHEVATHVTAARDKDLLKIPLRRQRNPNEPVTVELEYGEEHGRLTDPGELALEAPASTVRSTFGQWNVTVPADWAVFARPGGNMVAADRGLRCGTVSAVVRRLATAWKAGGRDLLEIPMRVWLPVGLVLIGGLVLVVLVRRQAVPRLLLALVLLALVCWGVAAADRLGLGTTGLPQGAEQALRFTRALSPEDAGAVRVEVTLRPAWRAYVDRTEVTVGAIVAVLGLGLGVWLRRARPLLLALALAGATVVAAQFPAVDAGLRHLFTWGLPVLLLLFLLEETVRGWRARLAPAAVALVLLVGVGNGLRAGAEEAAPAAPTMPVVPAVVPVEPPVAPAPVLASVDCRLAAEKDSMKVDLRLTLEVRQVKRQPQPVTVRLADSAAVLLSPDVPFPGARVRLQDGAYQLRVEKAGTHEIELSFLCPLPPADDNQTRRFQLPLPTALVKKAELRIPQAAVDVESPTAVSLTKTETDAGDATVTTVLLGPTDGLDFVWKPRVRQAKLEKTSFFADVLTLVRFGTGLAEGHNRIRFQVAQGELRDLRITVPAGVSVTTVDGPHLGAWRFDPAKHELEIKLAQPATEEYALTVITQNSYEKLPCAVTIAPLVVQDAVHQRGLLGLAPDATVYLTVEEHPESMNVDDFARAAGPHLQALKVAAADAVRHAFRVQQAGDQVKAQVNEVKPEIRSHETADFTVADDRLVYNGEFVVEVAKAGVFSCDLSVPETVDIDTLGAPEVSHWDESGVKGGVRSVRVYFRQKLLGKTALKVALSRPVSELPPEITVPRLSVDGAVKHEGQVVISADRGVRLIVGTRRGVSEQDPVELGIRREGTIAFRLLRPDWELTLQTEVVKPRINVEFLHVARVSEGLVRHTHHLVYSLQNAGTKVFEVKLPESALGVVVSGPDIARREPVAGKPGVWRVELAHKWFDRPYLLTVAYETQYDRAKGEVDILTAQALGADLQRGHVVTYASSRIELAPARVGPALQPAEARNIAGRFGAGDLSDAAFCYSCTTPEIDLAMTATRHDAAGLLEAEVLGLRLVSVATERGESLNRLQVDLKVGSKRHLQTRLPAGATVWSLMVNRRPQVPSLQQDAAGRGLVLVPLAPGTSGELPVTVDLIYAVQPATGWQSTAQAYDGPEFDLPLRNVTWQLYLPEGWEYKDFGGTLTVDRSSVEHPVVCRYDVQAYEAEVVRANTEDLQKASDLQSQGNKLAQAGRQYEAKQALASAYNYSFADPALNEDTRVQLRKLVRQQALVGLVSRRNRLRQDTGETAPEGQAAGGEVQDLGDRFSQADADRLQSSLSKDDSENLESITDRLIEVQEAAEGAAAQLLINMPLRGRAVRFGLPLQVNPNAPMRVTLAAERVRFERYRQDAAWGGGLCGTLLVVLAVGSLATARRRSPRPRPPRPPAEPPPAAAPPAESPTPTPPPAE